MNERGGAANLKFLVGIGRVRSEELQLIQIDKMLKYPKASH